MFKMVIELDKEKILCESDVPYEIMMKWLDKICSDSYFNKIGIGVYSLQNGKNTIGSMLILVSQFEQQSWLKKSFSRA